MNNRTCTARHAPPRPRQAAAAAGFGAAFAGVPAVRALAMAVLTAGVLGLWAAQPRWTPALSGAFADHEPTPITHSQPLAQVPAAAATASAGAASPAPLGYEPRELLVAGPTVALLQELSRRDFRVMERAQLAHLGFELFRLQVSDKTTVPQALGELRGGFPQALIDANHIYLPANVMTTGPVSGSWARSTAGWGPADEACGRSFRIGIIDTPVDVDHPALAGSRVEFRDFHRPDRQSIAADHGTAIAAMFAGRNSGHGWGGIFPGAEIKAANMFELNEDGRLVGNAMSLLKALDWLASERVHVVNLSIAGSDNEVLRYGLGRARGAGLTAVAAAGNFGRDDRPAFPAAYEDVIAVTAFGAGGEIFWQANRGTYIDFAAPGVEIWTAVPGGGRMQSGTSFAAPFVSAQVAAEVARRPGIGAEELRQRLRRRAVDMGTPGPDETYGWGYVADTPSCN